MYLAKLTSSQETCYEIRVSFRRGDNTFGHRLVFDLGEKPEEHFEIYEDYIVLFNQDLLNSVESIAGNDAEQQLEQILWDFFPAQSRERLEVFRGRSQTRFGPLTDQEKADIMDEIHIFDRRRLYYLRYGAVDQSRLSRLHEKCCRPLLGQSRDERECYFEAEEKVLEPGMYLQYVYAIFNLQNYFTESFAPWFPEAIAIEAMGEHLERTICLLQADTGFWKGEPESRFLHHHLARYLIMFFDFSASPRSFFDDFSRSFMADHRSFRWPEKSATSPEKMSEVFSMPYKYLEQMSKGKLNKLYRQKAMDLHPDKGGDHEKFIELTEIYNELLKAK